MHAWPSSRQAASSSARSPIAAARLRTVRATSAAVSQSPVSRRAADRRSCSCRLRAGSVSASARAVDLGERLEAVARAVEHAERVVAQEQERHPVARLRDDREAELDRAQDLLRGVPAERLAGGLDREPRARLGVAGRTGVVGEHRQALRSRLAVAAQQLDDDRMDLPASARRQRVDDELANLLVREPVVRRRPFGISDQEPCGDRGRERARPGRCPRRTSRPAALGSARRSRRLKLRPRTPASARRALVSSGRRAARRPMSVRTAEGTSFAAFFESVQVPSTWRMTPASR